MTESTMRAPHTRSSVSLREFQAGFARALTAIDAHSSAAPEIADLARQPGFAVYRKHGDERLHRRAASQLPVRRAASRRGWFRAAAALYVRAHPPRQPMLVDYGDGFASFLAKFEPRPSCDISRASRGSTVSGPEAHVANDEAPVPASNVARCSPQELALTVLRPHAAARWAWFDDQPTFTLWRRSRELRDDDLSDVDWRPEARWSRGHRAPSSGLRSAPPAARFLDACAAGTSLGAAAAAALAADPEIDLAALMANCSKPARSQARPIRNHPRRRNAHDSGSHHGATAAAGGGLRGAWNRVADALTSLIGDSLLALAARFGIAGIFFLSGRTKVEGPLTVSESAYALFREEYRVPILPPEIAVHLAAYAEHLFPVLLVLGLFTRLSALALLGMTQ